jgi:hypothetical protein
MPRLAAGDLAYHVLNRRGGRLPLFEKPADYAASEKILAEAHARPGSESPPIAWEVKKGSGMFFTTTFFDP